MLLLSYNSSVAKLRQPLFYRRSGRMMAELNGNTVNALVRYFPRNATYRDVIRLGREGRLRIPGIGTKRNAELERWIMKYVCPAVLL